MPHVYRPYFAAGDPCRSWVFFCLGLFLFSTLMLGHSLSAFAQDEESLISLPYYLQGLRFEQFNPPQRKAFDSFSSAWAEADRLGADQSANFHKNEGFSGVLYDYDEELESTYNKKVEELRRLGTAVVDSLTPAQALVLLGNYPQFVKELYLPQELIRYRPSSIGRRARRPATRKLLPTQILHSNRIKSSDCARWATSPSTSRTTPPGRRPRELVPDDGAAFWRLVGLRLVVLSAPPVADFPGSRSHSLAG